MNDLGAQWREAVVDVTDIAARLNCYRFHDRYQVGNNDTCQSCALESSCGKGCPAAVISAGQRIGAVEPSSTPPGELIRHGTYDHLGEPVLPAERAMPSLSALTLNVANPSAERTHRQLEWLASRDDPLTTNERGCSGDTGGATPTCSTAATSSFPLHFPRR